MSIVGTKPIQNCGEGIKVFVLFQNDPLGNLRKGDLASDFPYCELFTGRPYKSKYLKLRANKEQFIYECLLDCNHRTDRNREK